jgi:nucleotide-binding universal stress UspA family protein
MKQERFPVSTVDSAGPAIRLNKVGFRRVIVPLGRSVQSMDALALAPLLLAPTLGKLRVVHIRTWRPLPPTEEGAFLPELNDLFSETRGEAAGLVDGAVRRAQMDGVEADGLVVDAPISELARSIVKAADEWRADVVVLCQQPRRGLGSWLRRSVSEQVMRGASCSVFVPVNSCHDWTHRSYFQGPPESSAAGYETA